MLIIIVLPEKGGRSDPRHTRLDHDGFDLIVIGAVVFRRAGITGTVFHGSCAADRQQAFVIQRPGDAVAAGAVGYFRRLHGHQSQRHHGQNQCQRQENTEQLSFHVYKPPSFGPVSVHTGPAFA